MANNDNTDDEHLFRSFVNDVTPLQTQTVAHNNEKPKALVKKQPRLLDSTISSPKSLANKSDDEYFAFHVNKKSRKNLKLGNLRFDATLDLHGHTVTQSERLLKQFIDDCQHQNIHCAIIVHGQGHHSQHGSILKPAVLYWLSCQEAVDAFCPAQSRDGGKGASYVLLRKNS